MMTLENLVPTETVIRFWKQFTEQGGFGGTRTLTQNWPRETGVMNERVNNIPIENRPKDIIEERNGDLWMDTFRPDHLFGPTFRLSDLDEDDDHPEDGYGGFGSGPSTSSSYTGGSSGSVMNTQGKRPAQGLNSLMPSRKASRR